MQQVLREVRLVLSLIEKDKQAQVEGRKQSPVHQALQQIRARAGAPGWHSDPVPVYLAHFEDKPPTLQRVRKDRLGRVGKGTHGRLCRRIIVGRRWLQENAPDIWAAFMAARLTDHPDASFIPKLLEK